ncbi:MAG: multi-sensor signal transduction histidine kinase [Caulobacteraceae bacterium]|nr:multi-sensor signal transduction histidine kinase [Caulobacteraceae bacterium]
MLLTVLVSTGATTRFDNAIYDLSLRLKHTSARPDIVIVAVDPASLQAKGEWPWHRGLIANLVNNIARDRPTALAFHFLFFLPSPDDKALHDAIARTRTYLGVPHREPNGGRGAHPLQPAPMIASAAAGWGAGDSQPDQDGIVRRTLLFEGPSNDLTPRMVLQMARLDGRHPDGSRAVSRNGEMLIPYAGPPGTFTTVPAISVLQGKVTKNYFRNKFVLIGATAPELLDNYPTPRSGAKGMPSVEVDANVLNSLLDGVAITPVSRPVTLAVSIVLLWVLLVALLRLSPQGNLRLAAGLSGLALAGSVLGVVGLGVWAPPAPYLATMSIILPYWGWRRLNAASAYFAEQLRVLERNAGGAILAQSRSVAQKGGDVVLQQMTLLEETRKRISDLRRFVADILADFPDPVLVVDRAGRILTVNQAASDFADGLEVSTAPGAPIEPVLSKIATSDGDTRPLWPPPEGIDMFGSSASARPLTGQGPSGRSYELRFTPTRSAEDEPTGWIVHLADITPLVSAMRQREEALQLLSHDMRSPLSAILASLEHPYFRGAPATLRRRIEGQAGRTLELADAFVRLAKAESADYEFEPIDLSHVLSDAVDNIWPLAQAGDVTVEFDIAELEYVVLADRGLVTRALVNLLDNAVKYSPAGKAVVCRLAPAALNGRPAVACEIADSAGGMAQSQLDRLFRRFATSRDALNGTAGVGLGLALVHTVVTRHNGIITCESADGEGTVFTITLPLHVESEARAPELTDA